MVEKKPAGRRGRLRAVSDEEQRLWLQAMRDASPLPPTKPSRRRKQTPLKSAELSSPPDILPIHPAALSSQPVPASPLPKQPASPVKPARHAPPPLTGIDRRLSQKLGRGQVEYDAKLDLHGHSREGAYVALRRFLTDARRAGLRCVLVVTGKGDHPFARHTLHSTRHYDTPERQGILRSALPQWLEEAELRALVSGFQPAHPKHGGGGAFYVLLRRKQR